MALRKLGHSIRLSTVASGEEAVQYLEGHEPYSRRESFPFPDLIISDLKMPRMSGIELLAEVRARWGSLPFVMFSNSGVQEDVDLAYRAGANSYLTKPADFDGLVQLFGALYGYWSRCEQPTRLPASLANPAA
jgi:CheY-like chemotaxis protein